MRYHFSKCILDTERQLLTRKGEVLKIEPQVYDLLKLLIENVGRVVSKDEIIDVVWQGRVVSEATIAARINAARKAVGDSGAEQAIIRTVQRRGLEWVAEAATEQSAPQPVVNSNGQQKIRFALSKDGTSIAYAVSGSGPPLVYVDRVATNLELDWNSWLRRPFFEELARSHTLYRYDFRGTGLSEQSPPSYAFERHIEDLDAVVNATGADKVSIVANMSGGPVSLRYVADHPAKVDRLVSLNGYCEGRLARQGSNGGAEDPLLSIIREAWNKGGIAFERSAVMLMCPDATREEGDEFLRLFTSSATSEAGMRLRASVDTFTALDALERITCPTLVIYSRSNGFHPFSEATKIASHVKDCELIVLESGNSFPTPSDPTWRQQMDAIESFLTSQNLATNG